MGKVLKLFGMMYVWGIAVCMELPDSPRTVQMTVDVQRVIHTTDERYLSLVMGPTVIRHNWGTFNLSSQRLYTLASALAPAVFRVGGSGADLLIFNQSAPDKADYEYNDASDWDEWDLDYGTPYDADKDPRTNFTMTAHQWDQLNEFTRKVGWNLLFDLNVLLRRGAEWDASNALELIRYSIKHNYTDNLNFELGNEPDSFRHFINRTLDPVQLGKDFLQLHYLLRQSTELHPYFTHSLLVGPDTTKPRKDDSKVLDYLRMFLKVAGDSLSAITWHQYYVDGRTAKAADFIDPAVLVLFPQEAARVKAVIREVGLQDKPLMMGETGSCWGGGAPNLSDRYAGGFLWLDKLGIAAQMGHNIVMRQTFYEGSYGLIDRDLNPTPDYWLSLMYKVLVGTKVLNVTTNDTSAKTRVYAHCTATSRSEYPRGAVTVYALNLHTSSVELTFTSELAAKVKHLFWFKPHGDDGMSAKHVNINGEKMMMVDDVTFPKVMPKVTTETKVKLPKISYGFIVIPDAKVSVCL